MNQKSLIEKIKRKAKLDEKNRRDPRFIETMGFLVAKGFLKTNRKIRPLPNHRIRLDDALWAGQNVEPRILEVLPAAVVLLGKHFDLDPTKHKSLAQVVEKLRKREEQGEAFYGIPYAKIKVWVEHPLRDRRVKPVSERKVVKTFRLKPAAVARLQEIAAEKKVSETKILENLILGLD